MIRIDLNGIGFRSETRKLPSLYELQVLNDFRRDVDMTSRGVSAG